jgi:hypothetical protein
MDEPGTTVGNDCFKCSNSAAYEIGLSKERKPLGSLKRNHDEKLKCIRDGYKLLPYIYTVLIKVNLDLEIVYEIEVVVIDTIKGVFRHQVATTACYADATFTHIPGVILNFRRFSTILQKLMINTSGLALHISI